MWQTVSPEYMKVEVVLRGEGNVTTDCRYVSNNSADGSRIKPRRVYMQVCGFIGKMRCTHS